MAGLLPRLGQSPIGDQLGWSPYAAVRDALGPHRPPLMGGGRCVGVGARTYGREACYDSKDPIDISRIADMYFAHTGPSGPARIGGDQ